MGCDFYTYYKVCIEYKKGEEMKLEEHEVEESRERHYFWDSPEWDEDFEDRNDYFERCHKQRNDQIEAELSRYKNAHLYKNKQWLCVVDAKNKYQNLLKKLDVSESSVIQIWKQGGFHMR
jgi:hypothetical protein